ncbi:MAG: MBL fold metallo-hydrolase [Rhodospirillum sp.]|nr:MBL fold metallo-hydrolase [Rhodospirillum sp.]MCF8489213.1 MBL fold metallo-hydrolase [Rhodospirillum sp.]MCF8502456.1 MBL fold metallo-hydrolase [Rhodospirillum sp.]
MSQAFTLRPDVVAEPLIARWHASPHLLAPVTGALNVAHRHLKQMASYVAMPLMHAAALKNPALQGGPFLDLGGERADEVKALMAWTKEKQAPALALAEDVAACWSLLKEADGKALAPLYARLPGRLRGAVELVYTPTGAPDARINEALLYRSDAHDPSLQGIMLRRVSGDGRPFAMSTPRLDEPGSLYLDLPFADSAHDLLGSLRRHPRPLDEIAQALNVEGDRLELLKTFLTDESPPPRRDPATVTRWRYFGHACVLVESAGGKSVLVDPVIAYAHGDSPARYTAADLPERIDYVVITHNHADHALIETLLALRWQIGAILVPPSRGSLVDPSLRLALRAAGFQDVREVPDLEGVTDGDLSITALPFLGEHADLDIRAKAAWMVEAGDRRLVFAADSNNLDPALYDRLTPMIGRVDHLFLGMECRGAPMSWLYGCLLPEAPDRETDQARRLDGSNCDRALAVLRSLDVGQVHIYAMGLEPWLVFITSLIPDSESPQLLESNRFLTLCADRGVPGDLLYGRAEG